MKLLINQVGWSERLEKLLIEMNPLLGVTVLRRLVDEGVISVHEVFYDGTSVGFYIYRIDVLSNGDRELVIMHALSHRRGEYKPLSHICSSIFPGFGMQLNCKRVRIHSDVRKIDDLLEEAGYVFKESVFTKEI